MQRTAACPSRPQRGLRARTFAVSADAKLFSGSGVRGPEKGKHFLHLDDFTKDELLNMLAMGKLAKEKFYARDESFKPFAGQTMAMIFTKPSARTRVSFETVRAIDWKSRHGALPAQWPWLLGLTRSLARRHPRMRSDAVGGGGGGLDSDATRRALRCS